MKLTEMPNTGVIINTEEEYNELLKMRADAGWSAPKWIYSLWPEVKGHCIYVDDHPGWDKVAHVSDVITLQQFKEAQNIMKYQEGDVLENKTGYERTVLGICGQVYFMSYDKDPQKYYSGYTEKELDNSNFTIKVDTPEPEVIETEAVEVTSFDTEGWSWTTYTTENGLPESLPDNIMKAIAVGPDGDVWVDTRRHQVLTVRTEDRLAPSRMQKAI